MSLSKLLLSFLLYEVDVPRNFVTQSLSTKYYNNNLFMFDKKDAFFSECEMVGYLAIVTFLRLKLHK